MTVDMEKYEELLQQFGGISHDHITREALEKLKEKYRNDIDSKRVLNSIIDINCLLQVLKKRGVLRYNDIKALREITDECVRNESVKQQIRDLIVNYSQWLDENSGSINILYNSAIVPLHSSVQSVPGQNMPFHMSNTSAAGYSTQSTFSVNHTQFYTSTVPPVDRERELRKLVINALSKRIGADWKDVCRALDISENTIDEIAVQFSQAPVGNKNELMFKRGMQLYFSEPRPRWRSDLKKALRISRRVDLAEKVEEILENHSNM